MLARTTLFSLLAACAAAESSTTSIFLGSMAANDPGDSENNGDSFLSTLVASVIDVDPTATTFALNCKAPPDTKPSDNPCLYPAVTITANPSLFVMQTTQYGEDDPASTTGGLTMSTRCELQSTTAGRCTWFEGGDTLAFDDSNDPEMMTTPITQTLAATDITFTPVTITAGLEKLGERNIPTTVTTTAAAAGSTGASSGKASSTSKGNPDLVTATASGSGSAAVASQTGNSATSVSGSSVLFVPFTALLGYLLA